MFWNNVFHIQNELKIELIDSLYNFISKDNKELMNILSIVIKMKLLTLTNKENNYEINCTSSYRQLDYSLYGYHTLFKNFCNINDVFGKN